MELQGCVFWAEEGPWPALTKQPCVELFPETPLHETRDRVENEKQRVVSAAQVQRAWEHMAGLDSTWELDPLLDTFHIDGSRRTATRVVASPARDALTKPACSRRAEAELVRSDTVQSWKLDALGLPELVALAGLVGFGVVLRVHRVASIWDAGATTVGASVSLVMLGQLLVRWSPTHFAGRIVQNRLVHARRNWSERTLRSAVETSAWLAAVMVSQAVLQDVVAAAIVGALAGLSISVFGELCMCAGAARPESALPPNADRGKIFREEAGVSVLVPKFVAPARRRMDFRPAGVTMKELSTHNTRGDRPQYTTHAKISVAISLCTFVIVENTAVCGHTARAFGP